MLDSFEDELLEFMRKYELLDQNGELLPMLFSDNMENKTTRCNSSVIICSLNVCFWLSDTFTDTAISSSRINGEHKEKVLQKWEGGDSNGESYDLENDAVSQVTF